MSQSLARLIIDPTASLTSGDPMIPLEDFAVPTPRDHTCCICYCFSLLQSFLCVITLTLLTTTVSYFLYPQFEFLCYFLIMSFRLCILARVSQKRRGVLRSIGCHVISSSPITDDVHAHYLIKVMSAKQFLLQKSLI